MKSFEKKKNAPPSSILITSKHSLNSWNRVLVCIIVISDDGFMSERSVAAPRSGAYVCAVRARPRTCIKARVLAPVSLIGMCRHSAHNRPDIHLHVITALDRFMTYTGYYVIRVVDHPRHYASVYYITLQILKQKLPKF